MKKRIDDGSFGRRLNRILNVKGITSKCLSQMTGIGERAIGKYRQGTREPKACNLAKIAVEVGVTADWLCGITGEIDDYDVCSDWEKAVDDEVNEHE